MAKKRTEIIDLNIQEVIDLLNKAYADEWFAYYQYWIGAKLVTGLMRDTAVSELSEHADDELKHAGMLAERIIQLGGTPITNPGEFGKFANCPFANPTDISVKAIIQQAAEGERCAIEVYDNLLKFIKDKDVITYQMVLSILEEEIEHETDFENLLEDLK